MKEKQLDNLVKDNYNKFKSESGHWYTQEGEPMYTIIGANGKERNTTLRDAKSLGLVPSVTTIMGIIAKPSLETWKQKQLLNHLMIKSCKVAGIFGLVLLGLIGYGLFKRYKIKWKWIWVENFLMFVLLGIFEYWFFMNVILNYNPITDAEIKYYVANQIVNYFNSTI